jgi:hypothetical protein
MIVVGEDPVGTDSLENSWEKFPHTSIEAFFAIPNSGKSGDLDTAGTG